MSAVSFYSGAVSHTRFEKPFHRFRYRIAYLLIDLDKLEEAANAATLLSIGRRGMLSFRAEDHGDGSGRDLAQWVRSEVSKQAPLIQCSKIKLLTLPRMFGYVFNPISAYYIYDHNGRLHHVLYEVNNTFGGRQVYLCGVNTESEQHHHFHRKEMYVSPFIKVEGGYAFSLLPPEETLGLTINYLDPDGKRILHAHFQGKRKRVTNWQCLKILGGFPLMTVGVIFAIHWQALRLFVKGARYAPQTAGGKHFNEKSAGKHQLGAAKTARSREAA